jgi:hypothetical protein
MVDNNDGLLKPGAIAQMTFQLAPTPNSMNVPAGASLFRNEAFLLAPVDKDSRIQMKRIEIVRDHGARLEIASGLSAADAIVRNPLDSLAQGDAVNVVDTGGVKQDVDANGRPKLAVSAAK